MSRARTSNYTRSSRPGFTPVSGRRWFPSAARRSLGSLRLAAEFSRRRIVQSQSANNERQMVTLRVVRHDRHEQLLAECLTTVLPERGEVLQLDTFDTS